MKKLLSIALSLVLSMSLMTGCTSGTETQEDPQPTPTPAPTATPAPQEEEIENPNYRTVLAMWEDMDGYWAANDGHYMDFSLNEEGKAELHIYDKDGKLTGLAETTAVMASNKTSYIMEFRFPAVDTEELKQAAKEDTYNIEIAGYGDGYVEITDAHGRTTVYAYAGEDTAQLKEAVKYAANVVKAAEKAIENTKETEE